MNASETNAQPSRHCVRWERTAWILVGINGILLIASALFIVVGSVYQPEAGLFGLALSDPMALVWITVASFAHLAFVPAFCAAVALRDHRRQLAGTPIPKPRSIWVGHDSVFGDEWRKAS